MSTPRVLTNFWDGKPQPHTSTFDRLSPATGKVIVKIPDSGASEAKSAIDSATKALSGPWSSTTVEARAALLDRIAARIEADLPRLAAMESEDTGKPISTATTIDIPRAVANFRFFSSLVRQHATGFHAMHDALNYTLNRPAGVVTLITPWNLPLYLLSWKTAPALAMGNTIVAKPSEMTPSTASALAEIIVECGAPPGVFNIVHGRGPALGPTLCTHPRVSAISFTGGTATGAIVAAAAAPLFKKLSLELGGKNATVVFADCDFDATVAGAVRAGFTNQGQVCLCGSRLLVEASVAERFVPAFVAAVRALRVGDPTEVATQQGALISPEHLAKVAGYVEMARDIPGAEILCGGAPADVDGACAGGAFYQPTVIGGLSPTSRPAVEEIFGPVVTVHTFTTEQEAVEMANGTPYGLAASVWTEDLRRGHRVAAQLETGMVWVNCWLHRDLRTPFGGMKHSGVGREGGELSLQFFSETRNVCVKVSEGWAPGL
eukprot:TRINITY_DN6292_c0_g1_i1.p1 TRINITY_DN6292_c0_g1~~TRINITY_DN6292_c0_g1_i1.p1  ORF type:complete len:491 (-),score=95.45 TRINITY_DN6292_c0_g1_i1:35-1507(-)